MQLNGARIIIECLKEQGVDTVFGFPGGAILNVYDALYTHGDGIHHVLTSHEQGASHAADGYARASGKVGVCLATSGPGATNLVTGIATAYMDSVPMVAITCNVTVGLLGKDSFQEVDIAGITMPVTKHNFIVKDVNSLADTLRRAFLIAKSGRPGPVLVDVTKDVTALKADYKKAKPQPKRDNPKVNVNDIKKACELIKRAKKPYIFVGGGCSLSGATKELDELVELVDAPVCDTLMGKGAYDGNKNRYTGMLGMHGTKVSNFGVSECDLLIAIGTRFSDRILGKVDEFAKHAKIIQFDIDPVEINKNIIVDLAVIGDIKESLGMLIPMLEQKSNTKWNNRLDELKKKYPVSLPDKVLSGPYIIDRICKKTNGDAIVVTEVGQNQMWAAQYYKYKDPRQFLSSGGLGTMGYGLGASIGAQLARPDKKVVLIAGDGCFRMNAIELMTAAREKLPIIEVIINNKTLGMVRQWQDLFYDKHFSHTTLDDGIDLAQVASSMGATAFSVNSKEEFEEAFDKALKANGPCVLDCHIDMSNKVWPMVAAGTPISECFSEEDR